MNASTRFSNISASEKAEIVVKYATFRVIIIYPLKSVTHSVSVDVLEQIEVINFIRETNIKRPCLSSYLPKN